jgi:cell division protein FtsQ
MRRLAILFAGVAVVGAVGAGLRASDRWPQIVSLYNNGLDHSLDLTALAGLRLEALTVEGRVSTNAEDILASIDVERGTPILSINVAEARESIETLPWVKSAQVERQMPNSIHVIIQERTAYALWQRGARYTLIDAEGHSIADVPGQIGELPLVVGVDAPAHTFELFELLKAEPALQHRVQGAVRIGERRWNLHFDSLETGITVRLPETDLATSLKRLADLQREHNILDRDLASIDLRLEDRLIVQLNPGATPPGANTKTTTHPSSAAKSAEKSI